MFPKPPLSVLDTVDAHFEAAPRVRDWAFQTFIEEGSSLQNPDHEHLAEANILFMWASYAQKKDGKEIAGTAECYRPQVGKWAMGRSAELLRGFNGGIDPDFIVTLWAGYVHEASPEAVCALVEHELYHCSQATDKDGEPKFVAGIPCWAIKGHDVEEFVGVARRYGAYSAPLRALQEAFEKRPAVARSASDLAICGCGATV